MKQWRSWARIDARAHKNKNYAQDPKIYLKAKKKELSAWDLNHRSQAYISTNKIESLC